MHPERGEVSEAAADAINAARRVVAVGTTTLRLLECAAGGDGRVGAFRGDTRLFITPGFRFRVVDALLTNFHLPRSDLVHAGVRVRRAGADAVGVWPCGSGGYRFYSYGDASLLERA